MIITTTTTTNDHDQGGSGSCSKEKIIMMMAMMRNVGALGAVCDIFDNEDKVQEGRKPIAG